MTDRARGLVGHLLQHRAQAPAMRRLADWRIRPGQVFLGAVAQEIIR
jgi:hypothetical protein